MGGQDYRVWHNPQSTRIKPCLNLCLPTFQQWRGVADRKQSYSEMSPSRVSTNGTAGRLSTSRRRIPSKAASRPGSCRCRHSALVFIFLFVLQIAIMLIVVSWMNHRPLPYYSTAASSNNQVNNIPDLELFRVTSTKFNTTNVKKNNPQTIIDGKPYAYMWVIGGIHEDLAYKGFFYDVLVSVYLLKERLNSTDSDFWFFAQMASDAQSDSLPDEDRRLLNAMGIKLRMLEKPSKSTSESFASVMYEKFRALQLTQYRRVIFWTPTRYHW